MMLIRYILDFFVFYFRKCPYSRKNFYSNLLSHKKKTSNNYKFTKFEDWFKNTFNFQKIVVLGSGPSLNKLKKFDLTTLYLTSNSSVCKVINYNFVYFTFTREYINTYLKKGFKQKGWQGTFFLFTKSKKANSIRMASYQKIRSYLSTNQSHKNDILFSDIENSGIANSNYDLINQFATENMNLKFVDLNSGVSLLIIGIFLAQKRKIPIEIYGIDAGMGGKKYANSKIEIPGNEIQNSKNISALEKIYRYLKDNNIDFTNHTFYKPNV